MRMRQTALTPCEVSADCLECPLSRCKYDAPTWFQKGVQSRRAYAIAEAAERVGRDAAAAHCGVSKRTVFRVMARMTKDTNSPEDRAVFARLGWGGGGLDRVYPSGVSFRHRD